MKRIIMLSMLLILNVASAQGQIITPNQTTLPPIVPQQSSTDLQLTANINQRLREQIRDFQPQNFNIFSQSGQVTIQGRAASQSEVDEILSAARTVSGVSVVVNGIVITQ